MDAAVSTKISNEHQDPVILDESFFEGKTNDLRLCLSGAYNVTKPGTYKQEPPHYSMTARNEMPGDSTQKPGPGKYSPEKVWLHKKQSPGYSFGIRHSMYEAPLIVEVKE